MLNNISHYVTSLISLHNLHHTCHDVSDETQLENLPTNEIIFKITIVIWKPQWVFTLTNLRSHPAYISLTNLIIINLTQLIISLEHILAHSWDTCPTSLTFITVISLCLLTNSNILMSHKYNSCNVLQHVLCSL